jgi:t-SNARE complex subunit (syntaxin)
VTYNIAEVSSSAENVGTVATEVNTAATNLSAQSDKLQVAIKSYLSEARKAV